MDLAYNAFLRVRLSAFTDTFSSLSIATDQICYPISYLSKDSLEETADAEDDQLLNLSLRKDLPRVDKLAQEQPIIADGAAHLWGNRLSDPLVVLLGMHKIGKSSLFRKLALVIVESWTADNDIVPLIVPLREILWNDLANKIDFIENCFSQIEEFEAFLREKFFLGKLVLLLDGLEEVKASKEKLVCWVQTLRNIVNIPLCVVNSRFSGYCSFKGASVARMAIFPLKLQVSMAQHYLSELQYERFIELATSGNEAYCSFATSPLLLALLLDLLRWGRIGANNTTSKGKLTHLATKHLLGNTPLEVLRALEVLANDILFKERKEFSYVDLKRLGFGELWASVKQVPLVVAVEDGKNEQTSFDLTDDDCVRNSIEGIWNVRETPEGGSRAKCDSTPQWVGVSRESFMTYQIARRHIDKEGLTGERAELFRFWNLDFSELLAGLYACTLVEDFISSCSGAFMMESTVFSRAFMQCFPVNYLYSRKYRGVLTQFACLCSENVFENLVKFLFGSPTLEKCHIAQLLIRSRGSYAHYRPIINRLVQVKNNLTKVAFVKAFAHPASIVRKISRSEALEAGHSLAELQDLVSRNIEKTLRKAHWMNIHLLLPLFKELPNRGLKTLFSRLIECTNELIQANLKSTSKNTVGHKYLVQLFLNLLEVEDTPESSGAFTTPRSSMQSSPARSIEKHTEESTIRISFDRLNIPRPDCISLEKLGACNKLVNLLIEAIKSCSEIDLYSIVRLLIVLGCSMSAIHAAMAIRYTLIQENKEKLTVLSVLRDIGFVTQHTVDIPLSCLDETNEVKSKAESLLKLLNVTKLKKYAIKVLASENSKDVKAILALRGLGYSCKFELDNEVVEIIAQFIDHYNLTYRLEVLKSLYKLLKYTIYTNTSPTTQEFSIRRLLAAAPYVLKDRLMLSRYDALLRIASVKCLAGLWVVLDRGNNDTGVYEMSHVLVEGQSSSFLVGSADSMYSWIKRFLNSEDLEDQTAAWKSLVLMNCYEFLCEDIQEEFRGMLNKGLLNTSWNLKWVLEILYISDIGIAEYFSEIFLSRIKSFPCSVLETAAKILYKWGIIKEVKESLVIPSRIAPETSETLKSYREILSHLSFLIELDFSYITEASNSPIEQERIKDYKILSTYYKTSINLITGLVNSPKQGGPNRQQLLDVSWETSYAITEEYPKNSCDSSISDLEDIPPSIALCFELIKSGVRSDALKTWVLFYLKKHSTLADFLLGCRTWNSLHSKTPFYNVYVESSLNSFLADFPQETSEAILLLNFKSDCLCRKLIYILHETSNEHPTILDAIAMSMELSTSSPIEELYKLLKSKDSLTMQTKISKILHSLKIGNDVQLMSCAQALCVTKCGILVQKIWDYWMIRLNASPGYTIPYRLTSILEYTNGFDVGLLLSWARRLGLLKLEPSSSESTSTHITRNCDSMMS